MNKNDRQELLAIRLPQSLLAGTVAKPAKVHRNQVISRPAQLMAAKILIVFGIVLLIGGSALGETLYMRPNGTSYGSGNGSSWANAFSGWSGVSWGGGAGQLGAGDTLYVGVGTYNQAATFGASGTSANRITIRAAQDTQVGVATFTGASINFNANDYITFDGEYSRSTNFITSNLWFNCQNTTSIALRYCIMNNGQINAIYSDRGEYGFLYVSVGSGADYAWAGYASANSDAYDQTLIHDSHFRVPGKVNDGIGPDGLKPGTGITVSNCVLEAYVGTTTSLEHQDLIQCYGGRDNYLKVVGCEFIDSGDAQLGIDTGSSTCAHYRFYNNVFRRTVNNMGTVMLRMYNSGGTISTFNDVLIDNNTFVDGARTASSYGGAIRLHTGSGSTSATSCAIQNNIFYNCGDGWPAVLIENITANWSFSHNLLNAGSEGNTGTSSWTQSAGAQTGAPVFVAYVPYSPSNNLKLSSSDTAAKNHGTTLTSFSLDKGSVLRPQGIAWDIGAYEFAADVSTNPVILVSPASLDFGIIASGTTKDLTFTVRNVGGVTLPGAATVAAPFSIVSGGTYSLGSNQSQVVTVRYSPTAAGSLSRVITFTGGGGTSASANGSASAVLSGLSFESIAGTITAPFVADGGGFISQPGETGLTGGGRAVYTFVITNAGDYSISASVNAPADAANSFFINIDGEPTDPSMIWDVLPLTSGFENRSVGWRGNGTFDNPQFAKKSFTLSLGTHQLILVGREGGIQLGRITISPSVASIVPPGNLRVVSAP